MKIALITVSDRASAGVYEDKSGPALEEALREGLAQPGHTHSGAGADAQAAQNAQPEFLRDLVPDGEQSVFDALGRAYAWGADWILTTGGTGPAPRDRTPEASAAFCDRALPGLAEYLRAESLKETPNAVFSRQYAGMKGTTYVVNVPGSQRGARFCARLLAPLLEHGRAMARGEGH